ncbi:uncharacterized protein RCC_11512 [Ramularia collo-cygni]|uniref:SnoaL-like domain-containing protein n=1 Tax=Ramularia collo-cygni TaxID=112498 RepID=A0A2D3VSW2_9PEZI|nr:uncharacterized protein RCC_11512 [Ramularia collo-cygni]CZT25843.1 uncharacterized protein RCC_11512 [Ramularia collo-cygni]
MKSFTPILALGLAGLVQSLDMSFYKPGAGVEPEFKAYVEELYRSTEVPAYTTEFSNFFTPDGQLIVRGIVATGSDEIIALKQRLLPPAGNKHWNHRPNATTVDSDSSTQKVYQVLGVIQATYDGVNCSQAYYSTRFTVVKNAGVLSFETHAGNLAKYDDFIIQPSVSPTDIACDP